MTMEICVTNEQDTIRADALVPLVQQAVAAALAAAGVSEPCEVSVTFVDNASIRQLNAAYRQKDMPTDVLSFPQGDDDFASGIPELNRVLGDIVISLERAWEQSQDYGHSMERETAFLTVHGLLHLLGYDHEDGLSRCRMREMEECVMERLRLVRDEG